jgi:anthranilate synthase/aminodeoxychorismate synthase-like glutamine amidotransferase
MIFVLDNYDSFTFNLVQYIGETGEAVEVRRNNEISVEDIEAMAPRKIVISPGPRTPNEAGITVDLIRHLGGKIPILGVCLGHQAIGSAFGGRVVRSDRIMHGKTSMVEHDGRTIFRGVGSPMVANRYHSLIVEEKNLPKELEISARSEENGKTIIMGLRHRELPIEGVQFHPESVLTPDGAKLIRNFLQ